MKKITIVLAGFLFTGSAVAESLAGVDRFICAPTQTQICLEADTCYASEPWELGMPEFVVIDLKKSTMSTTKASGEERSTAMSKAIRSDGQIFLQGNQDGRLFSVLINESVGLMSLAVVRDGMVVSGFGSCTDADI